MATAAAIIATLDSTQLRNCCIMNPYLELNGGRKDPRRDTWGSFQHKQNKVTAVSPDALKDPLTYLKVGKALAGDMPWAGVCQTFACVSSYLINVNHSDVRSIELFSFGNVFNGHVFLVLDRSGNSDESKPDSWGNAMVVDQWYAAQATREDKAVAPVFETSSAADYMTWLKKKPTIKRVLKVT